jgi:cation:H+ antiporter
MLHDVALPVNVAIFLGSGAVVWFAGARLARLADAIADRTGLGRVLLGMILLAGVTSLPELAIAVTATLQGTPILTVNDVFGSAAANLVVLAVADLVVGRDALTSVQGSPQLLLQAVLGIVLMALAVGPFVAGDVLVLGMGAFAWLLLVVYVGSMTLLTRSRAGDAWRAASGRLAAVRAVEPPRSRDPRSLGGLASRTAAAAAAILVAGFLLTKAGDALAEQSGLGASFFAVVFLAIATSLPEVSTVIGAVRLRRYEMAISDVLGTNLVNVTIVALVDALHPGGPVLLDAGRSAGIAALTALVLTAIFLAGMIERRDRTLLRMGPDSIAALLVYAGGLVLLYVHR